MGALQGPPVSAIVYAPLQLHRVCRGLYTGVLVHLPGFCSTFPGTPQKDLKRDTNNIKHGAGWEKEKEKTNKWRKNNQ